MAENNDKKVILQLIELLTLQIQSQDTSTVLQLVQRCERVMQGLLKTIAYLRKDIAILKNDNSAIRMKLEEQMKTHAREEDLNLIDSFIAEEGDMDNAKDDVNNTQDIVNQDEEDIDDTL